MLWFNSVSTLCSLLENHHLSLKIHLWIGSTPKKKCSHESSDGILAMGWGQWFQSNDWWFSGSRSSKKWPPASESTLSEIINRNLWVPRFPTSKIPQHWQTSIDGDHDTQQNQECFSGAVIRGWMPPSHMWNSLFREHEKLTHRPCNSWFFPSNNTPPIRGTVGNITLKCRSTPRRPTKTLSKRPPTDEFSYNSRGYRFQLADDLADTFMKFFSLNTLALAVLHTCLSFSNVPTNRVSGSETEKPNVVIVITDDQGYGDLSCHGNPILKTPNLDELHSQAVRLNASLQ